MKAEVKGSLFVASGSALFAGMALGARKLSHQMSAGQLSSARFIVGILSCLGIFLALRRRPEIHRFWLWAMRGLVGGASAYLYFFCIERIEVGPAVVLNNTSPVFASVFAFYFLRERMKPHAIMGLVLAILGSCLVALGSSSSGHPLRFGLGVWAGIASAVLSGAAITMMRSLRKDTDAVTIFFSFCIFGLAWSLPMATVEGHPLGHIPWVWALLVGILGLLAQLCYTHGLGFVSAGSGSALNLLNPAIAWTFAVIWLGESASSLSLIGACITTTALIWGTVAGPYWFDDADEVSEVSALAIPGK